MRLTLSNPEANAKFILNNGILISGDILVCEEEEILYKNLKLIGDYEYYNEKLQKFEFIYFYQCTRTYKMYQISGAIDGCKNICCLTASPISYDELKQKCIWRYYHIYINLQYERRKYIISNID
jgi:hypothetical protein